MKSRDSRFYAPRTTTTYDKDGNVLSRTQDRPEVQMDRIVVSNGLVKGNFSSPNSFSFTKTIARQLEGTSFVFTGNPGYLTSSVEGNQGYPVSTPKTLDSTSVYNRVLGEVNDKVRAPIDWSTNAAQAAQVNSMVRNAMRTLQHVKRSVSRLDLYGAYLAYQRWMRDKGRSATRATKELGSRWLEYQYGWKPLAQDVYNTAVEMGRDFPSLMIAEAKGTDRDQSIERTNWFSVPRVNDYTDSVRVQMKLRFRPNNSTAGLLSNFTSMNPASIAWEATPYSFVADWFMDVGGYMRNLETSLMSQSLFKDGFVTTSRKDVCTSTVNGDYISIGGGLFRAAHLGGTSVTTSLTRNVLSTYPLPAVPVFKAQLGSGRLLNAAALMSQELRVRR